MSGDFSLSYLIIKLGVHEHYRTILFIVNRKNYIISRKQKRKEMKINVAIRIDMWYLMAHPFPFSYERILHQRHLLYHLFTGKIAFLLDGADIAAHHGTIHLP